MISCSRSRLTPASLGGSASPENASPARTDGERIAEGANIRRQGRSYFANSLRTTPSTLRYRSWIGFPRLSQEAPGLARALGPHETPPRRQAAKRLEIKKKGRLSVDEVSDPPATDGSFRIIRVFRGPKNCLEQASALMIIFSLTFLASPPAGRTCPVDSVCQKVTALLRFREKPELPPIDG